MRGGGDRGRSTPSHVIQLHRKRFANALGALAKDAQSDVPAAFFPVIEVAAHCDHKGLCAALCPSGALRRYENEATGSVGLQFDSQACVACGLCVTGCPSKALRWLPAGNADTPAASSVQTLTQHTRKVCTQCDSPFVNGAMGGLCTRCGADRNLTFSFFGTKVANSTVSEGNFDDQ